MLKSFKSRCLASYIAIFMVYAFLLQGIFMPSAAYADESKLSTNFLATKSFIRQMDNNIYLTMALTSVYSSIKESLSADINAKIDINLNSLNEGKFAVKDIKADEKSVSIVFADNQGTKETSYVFLKTDFVKSENIGQLLESPDSVTITKETKDTKTLSIEKTQSKKSFLSGFALKMNKFLLIAALMFFVSIMPAYAEGMQDDLSPEHTKIENTFETELNGVMYDLGADLFMERNEKYSQYPGFYSDQQAAARRYVESSPYSLAGLNYNVHATVYRPLTLVDGTSSSFYAEVHRVAKEYKVSPYLLMMHAVTERMDLVAYEGKFDRLSSTASKGSFQISPVSLMRFVKNIYKLDREEREREYPFTRDYQSFNQFKRNFEVDDVLALDNDDNYNPLEIELAASYIKENFKEMQSKFPGQFPADFVTNPLVLNDSNQTSDSRNLMTLWSISYTANIHKYNTDDMFKIFDKVHDEQMGVYAWCRMSWRMFNYIENLDSLGGYQSFAYDSFSEISQAETRAAEMAESKLEVFLYYFVMIGRAAFSKLMSVPGLLGTAAFIATLAFLYRKTRNWRRRMKTKRDAFSRKIKQKPSVKYMTKIANKTGKKIGDSFMDFSERVFEDAAERRARKQREVNQRPASVQNQNINKAKRGKHGQRIKLDKGQMGVMYAAMGDNEASVFALEQQHKTESPYDFLLRLSDNYMDAIVERYPALASDEFDANDILKGVTVRLRDMDSTIGDKKVKEIADFIDNHNLYVPITSVLEFFESKDKNFTLPTDFAKIHKQTQSAA